MANIEPFDPISTQVDGMPMTINNRQDLLKFFEDLLKKWDSAVLERNRSDRDDIEHLEGKTFFIVNTIINELRRYASVNPSQMNSPVSIGGLPTNQFGPLDLLTSAKDLVQGYSNLTPDRFLSRPTSELTRTERLAELSDINIKSTYLSTATPFIRMSLTEAWIRDEIYPIAHQTTKTDIKRIKNDITNAETDIGNLKSLDATLKSLIDMVYSWESLSNKYKWSMYISYGLASIAAGSAVGYAIWMAFFHHHIANPSAAVELRWFVYSATPFAFGITLAGIAVKYGGVSRLARLDSQQRVAMFSNFLAITQKTGAQNNFAAKEEHMNYILEALFRRPDLSNNAGDSTTNPDIVDALLRLTQKDGN